MDNQTNQRTGISEAHVPITEFMTQAGIDRAREAYDEGGNEAVAADFPELTPSGIDDLVSAVRTAE